MTDTNNDNEYFSGGDFVFTQDSDKNIVGGGYKINSDLLEKTLSQTGGKSSSPFENLAVPAG